MTNYEWIRSLNPDELTIAICYDGTCGFCDKRVDEFGGCDAECHRNIREWMKEEHTEEE